MLEDPVDVGACFDELCGQPKRLRRRVRVLEAAGVGHEADVKRLGDLRRQVDVELAQDVADHLGRRRRVGNDEVDVAEARVVVVVVDVDHEPRAADRLRSFGDPALVRAVDCEQDAILDVGGQVAQ